MLERDRRVAAALRESARVLGAESAQVVETDAMAWLVGSELYGQLEKVVDRFEDVANEISGIVIENV